MNIEETKIKIKDLCNGYKNSAEEGVTAYGGLLDVRPRYQREFVYGETEEKRVIESVLNKRPLSIFYWCRIKKDNGSDGLEVLDGQQRIISICEYANDGFSYDGKYFSNLPSDEKEIFLNYELYVYICDGTDSEKLEWFRIINICGEPLTDQELRNAVYAGAWTSDAKRYFSKTGCVASSLASDYLKGSSIRQDYLETALSWISAKEGISIEEYMARHQNDATAVELWNYFQAVISWTKAVFTHYRKEMKGIQWGILYNAHKDDKLDPAKLEEDVERLMGDEDVTRKSGIYEYLLSGNEKLLSIRSFSRRDKQAAYERQEHKCAICDEEFDFEEMEGDHIIPWSKGGKTVPENCQMICKECNLRKSALLMNKKKNEQEKK